FDFQKQRVRVRTTSCADAHVACDFGNHAILLDVKTNFVKRGTSIQSQNSHGSPLIVVLEKSSVRLSSRRSGRKPPGLKCRIMEASGMPIWRSRLPCCAPTACGHAADPPSVAKNFRRPR